MVSHAMRRARPSGGTTVVLSNSSTSSGPAVHSSPRSARAHTRVGSAPKSGPKYTVRGSWRVGARSSSVRRSGTCDLPLEARAITRTFRVSTGFGVRTVAVLLLVQDREALAQRGRIVAGTRAAA